MPTAIIMLPTPVSINSMFGQAPGKKRYPSAKYKKWTHDAGYMLQSQRPPKYIGPVDIAITYEDKGRRDVDNFHKGICDLLKKHNVIVDDSRNYVRSLTLQWGDVQGAKVVIADAGKMPRITYSGPITRSESGAA